MRLAGFILWGHGTAVLAHPVSPDRERLLPPSPGTLRAIVFLRFTRSTALFGEGAQSFAFAIRVCSLLTIPRRYAYRRLALLHCAGHARPGFSIYFSHVYRGAGVPGVLLEA